MQKIHRKETKRDKEVRHLEGWLSSDKIFMASWRTRRNQRKLAYWQGKGQGSDHQSKEKKLEAWQNNDGLKGSQSGRREEKRLESFQNAGQQTSKGNKKQNTGAAENNASFNKKKYKKESRKADQFQNGIVKHRKRDRQNAPKDKKGKVKF